MPSAAEHHIMSAVAVPRRWEKLGFCRGGGERLSGAERGSEASLLHDVPTGYAAAAGGVAGMERSGMKKTPPAGMGMAPLRANAGRGLGVFIRCSLVL